MQEKHSGLILREQDVGENDRIVTILTADAGLIRAFAKGSKKAKGKLFASTRLFSYGDFVLYRGRDKFIVTEATRHRGFFGRIDNIEKLALAQYLCEICWVAVPQESGENTGDILRLLLNALYAIEQTDKSGALLKATFELRFMSLLGYTPQVSACADCGGREGSMLYYPGEGVLLCSDCAGSRVGSVPLDRSALSAMGYVLSCPPEKIFSYHIPEISLKVLALAAERTVTVQLERDFKTLDFYHTLTG